MPRLERKTGVTAAAVACTEDHLAATFERVARTRPQDADQLKH